MPEPVDEGCEGGWIGKASEIAEGSHVTDLEGAAQGLQEQAAEQAREHADGQEESRSARDPARTVERGTAGRCRR
jgi:hypothetical protein